MKFTFLTILLSSFAFFCNAQHSAGRVSDQNSVALPGVYLLNLRTGNHAHTDENGNFVLQHSKSGDSIEISHVGFRSQKLEYSTQPMNITMTSAVFQLNEVVVSQGINHLSSVSAVDLQTSPVTSSQELLRKVPGLFIGQHAGGGKAEQLFLRGFDLDHGTDINISVDGAG
jgi:hypothetical protein